MKEELKEDRISRKKIVLGILVVAFIFIIYLVMNQPDKIIKGQYDVTDKSAEEIVALLQEDYPKHFGSGRVYYYEWADSQLYFATDKGEFSLKVWNESIEWVEKDDKRILELE